MPVQEFFSNHATLVIAIAGVLVATLVLWRSNMLRYIPNNRIGIVEKLWSARGSLTTGFIALGGEAGFQADVLRGGWHMFFPFQYRVHVVPLVTIAQGKIGHVFARDGQTLPPTQALASNATAQDFTDASGFLRKGASAGHSAACCAKAPTRSTSRSSWSSPRTAVTTCRCRAAIRRRSTPWRGCSRSAVGSSRS
jgi:uncharacterized membrane protein YqiK